MKHSTVLLLGVLLLLSLLLACGQREDPIGVQGLPGPAWHLTAGAASFEGPTETVDLIAGQTEDIGSVTCWITRNKLFIEYETEGEWSLAKTQLAVAETVEGIPSTPTENPKVGLFPLKKGHPPFTTAHAESLDMDEWGFSEARELVIAAHADVQVLSGEAVVLREEGAWGMGASFASGTPPLRDVPDAPQGLERLSRPGKGRGNWATYFTVDVNKLKGLILWNKLGSEHEVTHSRVGPDGVIVGDIEYLPGKYGNGFKSLPRTGDPDIPDNYVRFDNLNLPQQGCVEFWYQPDWIDGTVGHCVCILFYAVCEDPSGVYLLWGFNDWQNRLNVEARDDLTSWIDKDFWPSSLPGWTTSEPFHMAMTWDGMAIYLDKLRFFLNGQEVAPPLYWVVGNPTFLNWLPAASVFLSGRSYSGDWYRHNWEGADGVIDNIKIWSYPKTDFSDRFNE